MGQPFPGCEASVKAQSPDNIVCSYQHCQTFQATYTYQINCNKAKEPLRPVSTGQCLMPDGTVTEIAFDEATKTYKIKECYEKGGDYQLCWCCCACYAVGTPIAVPGGMRAIEKLNIGDSVSVCTLGGGGKLQPKWNSQLVQFSSGTDSGSKSKMIYTKFADNRSIITTPDHLFLLANGKLKRADRLVPLQDQLVSHDGKPVDIQELHLGEWTKGVHHIATTDLEYNGSTDEHLLNSNGIITGDYILQINQDKLIEDGLMEDNTKMPAVGSEGYNKLHTHLMVTNVSALRTTANLSDIKTPVGFSRFTQSIYIPPEAGKLFTDEQAQDIAKNGSFRDLSDYSGESALRYLIEIYNTFYPDINICLDWSHEIANTYAFELYEKKHLVVSGKLIRLNKLYFQGYEFILAQGIARLLGKTPIDSNGLTYVGAADFYASSEVLRKVRYLDFNTVIKGVFTQIDALFGYIDEEHKNGNVTDIAHDPSIGCRFGALQNGMIGGSVPPCAGGPEIGGLKLLDIKPNFSGSIGEFLNLTFNMDIDSNTVEDLSNYMFSSDEEIQLPRVLTANIRLNDSKEVELRVQSLLDKEYALTVQGIKSTNGSTLDPQASSKKFKFSFKK